MLALAGPHLRGPARLTSIGIEEKGMGYVA
jgi:hypothetical protein